MEWRWEEREGEEWRMGRGQERGEVERRDVQCGEERDMRQPRFDVIINRARDIIVLCKRSMTGSISLTMIDIGTD